jgi:hypothetical protein
VAIREVLYSLALDKIANYRPKVIVFCLTVRAKHHRAIFYFRDTFTVETPNTKHRDSLSACPKEL